MSVPIKLSLFSKPAELPEYVHSVYNWPEGTFIQGGFKGLVVTKDPNNPTYSTTFIEAFPDNTFIRGEGETLEMAEKAAWDKFQQSLACPGHEWEARGYKNGAGFCKHCNKFASKVFTGEQLGQFCEFCKTGTTYSDVKVYDFETETWVDGWGCEQHASILQTSRYIHLKNLGSKEDFDMMTRAEFTGLEMLLRLDDEDEEVSETDESFYEALTDVLNALSRKDDEKPEE